MNDLIVALALVTILGVQFVLPRTQRLYKMGITGAWIGAAVLQLLQHERWALGCAVVGFFLTILAILVEARWKAKQGSGPAA